MARTPNQNKPMISHGVKEAPKSVLLRMLVTPAGKALLAQSMSLLAVFLLVAITPIMSVSGPISSIQWALLQGAIAAVIGHHLHLARWWLLIHLLFAPMLILLLALELPPFWFLLAFVLLALIYGKTWQTQVPLYLSSRAAIAAVATLLPAQRGFSLIDLGSGCGGLLHHLGKLRPDGNYQGVEAAPLPFLLSKCRNFGLFAKASSCRIHWGDFWKRDLAPYDVVYAYLSPVPMAALWRKACREMRPGSIFISNSFSVPGVTPSLCLKPDDVKGSTLHVWRM